MGKIVLFQELEKIRTRHPGKRIVHCHGVFDLFHYGHLLHFYSAKKFGDILVVTVTPDQFVNKGPGRPKYSHQKRAAMIAALDMVDYVAINISPRGTEPIRHLRPDFYVKGPDYIKKEEDRTGRIFEEEAAVDEVGGKLVYTADETESSTQLINEHFSPWDDGQRLAITRAKETMSPSNIIQFIDRLAGMKVLVVGEPIVDTYIFCQAEGISTKSPNLSARFLKQEDYAGGSLAIANHLAALGCEVTLLLTHGGEAYFLDLLKRTMNPAVRIEDVVIPDVPTPKKTRYITLYRSQRIFEIMNLMNDQWSIVSPSAFIERLQLLVKGQEVAIIADFGHGLFEESVLQAVANIPVFKAMNVQTNSGNFGFNPFTKHRHYDFLTLDERECRIAMHDRFTSAEELAKKTIKDCVKKPAAVTFGAAGSLYIDERGSEYLCPSFFRDALDTTGAGDAFFSLASLLVKREMPPQLIPFLGNCYAGLKTRIIGNKSAVNKTDFIRTIESILK